MFDTSNLTVLDVVLQVYPGTIQVYFREEPSETLRDNMFTALRNIGVEISTGSSNHGYILVSKYVNRFEVAEMLASSFTSDYMNVERRIYNAESSQKYITTEEFGS